MGIAQDEVGRPLPRPNPAPGVRRHGMAVDQQAMAERARVSAISAARASWNGCQQVSMRRSASAKRSLSR